jgi:putative FmdB family regulatory protein
MPFYEYECQACGRHHEAMQKMSDAPLRACPHCGRPRLKRLVSAPLFRLKGGGWYETDFKSDKETKRNLHGEEAKAEPAASDKSDGGDKKAEAAAPAKAESAAEAKPAAKAEPKPAKPAAPRRARRAARRGTKRR